MHDFVLSSGYKNEIEDGEMLEETQQNVSIKDFVLFKSCDTNWPNLIGKNKHYWGVYNFKVLLRRSTVHQFGWFIFRITIIKI